MYVKTKTFPFNSITLHAFGYKINELASTVIHFITYAAYNIKTPHGVC